MTEPESPSSDSKQPDEFGPPVPIETVEHVQFGVCLVITLIGYALFYPLVAAGEVSLAVTLAIPCAVGALCGCFAKDGKWLFCVGSALCVMGGIVCAAILGHAMGLFCGLFYAIIGGPPAMLSGLIVLWLRRRFSAVHQPPTKRTLMFWVAFPYLVHAVDALVPHESTIEKLSVSRVIAAPVHRVWGQSLEFESPSKSPWAVVDGPLPEHASGRASAVGDEKRIRFGKGEIVVRIVEVEPSRRIVADVLTQTIETRAVRLRRIVITCDPDSSGAGASTSVSITIEFEPLMRPRWYLRLYEPWFGRVAMDAVLAAWQARAEQPASLVR